MNANVHTVWTMRWSKLRRQLCMCESLHLCLQQPLLLAGIYPSSPPSSQRYLLIPSSVYKITTTTDLSSINYSVHTFYFTVYILRPK